MVEKLQLTDEDKRLLGMTPAPAEKPAEETPAPAKQDAAQPPKEEPPKKGEEEQTPEPTEPKAEPEPKKDETAPADEGKPEEGAETPEPEEKVPDFNPEPYTKQAEASYQEASKLEPILKRLKGTFDAATDANDKRAIAQEHDELLAVYNARVAAGENAEFQRDIMSGITNVIKAYPQLKPYIEEAIDRMPPVKGSAQDVVNKTLEYARINFDTEKSLGKVRTAAPAKPAEPPKPAVTPAAAKEAGKIFKKVATPGGGVNNGQQAVDWADVRKQANEGNPEAKRKLLAKDDPNYAEYAKRKR